MKDWHSWFHLKWYSLCVIYGKSRPKAIQNYLIFIWCLTIMLISNWVELTNPCNFIQAIAFAGCNIEANDSCIKSPISPKSIIRIRLNIYLVRKCFCSKLCCLCVTWYVLCNKLKIKEMITVQISLCSHTIYLKSIWNVPYFYLILYVWFSVKEYFLCITCYSL